MKKLFILSLGLFACLPVATHADQNLAGNVTITGGAASGKLNVTGAIDSDSNTFTFGTQSSSYGAALLYLDNAVDTLSFSINRSPASWLWVHNSNVAAMRLDSSHQLILYRDNGSTAGITLNPGTVASPTSTLSLGTATLSGNAGVLTTTSNFNFAGTDGSLALTASGVALSAVGGNKNVTLGSSGTGDLIFNTNGAERARIKSSGYFGVGTNIPSQLFHVNGGNAAILVTDSNSGGGTIRLGAADASKGQWAYDGSANTYFDFAQTLRLRSLTGGTYDRISILSNGNVGIGTSLPVARLQLGNNTYGVLPSNTEIAVQGGKSIRFMGTDGNGDYGAYFSSGYSDSTILTLGTRHGAGDIDALSIKSGNVGIGTPAPSQKLHVNGSVRSDATYPFITGTSGFAYWPAETSHVAYYKKTGSYKYYWRRSTSGYPDGSDVGLMELNDSGNLSVSGNVGIGTTSPQARLQLGSYSDGAGEATNHGELLFSKQNSSLAATGGIEWKIAPDNYGAKIDTIAAGGANLVFGLRNNSIAWTESMRINPAGNVGIGTTNPSHKLSVNGTIRAKEIIVDNTGWADYVFDESYALAPLSEVESHIKANKHLPGIPSAAEVAEHGVSMGDMQSKLLSKVEELTLHLIAQEKRIARLEQENQQLRAGSRP